MSRQYLALVSGGFLSTTEWQMDQPKARILCVDDHEDMHTILAAIFGGLGYELVSATSPLSGLVLARNQSFDLVVLDKLFGDGSGLDLCKRIREVDLSTPIVFFSGDVERRSELESMNAGAQAYVTKPDFGRLRSTVNALLMTPVGMSVGANSE